MLKIVTSFQTLMKYAHELGQAEKRGDPKEIAEKQKQHDAYKELCLKSDQMTLGCTYGYLADRRNTHELRRI